MGLLKEIALLEVFVFFFVISVYQHQWNSCSMDNNCSIMQDSQSWFLLIIPAIKTWKWFPILKPYFCIYSATLSNYSPAKKSCEKHVNFATWDVFFTRWIHVNSYFTLGREFLQFSTSFRRVVHVKNCTNAHEKHVSFGASFRPVCDLFNCEQFATKMRPVCDQIATSLQPVCYLLVFWFFCIFRIFFIKALVKLTIKN